MTMPPDSHRNWPGPGGAPVPEQPWQQPGFPAQGGAPGVPQGDPAPQWRPQGDPATQAFPPQNPGRPWGDGQAWGEGQTPQQFDGPYQQPGFDGPFQQPGFGGAPAPGGWPTTPGGSDTSGANGSKKRRGLIIAVVTLTVLVLAIAGALLFWKPGYAVTKVLQPDSKAVIDILTKSSPSKTEITNIDCPGKLTVTKDAEYDCTALFNGEKKTFTIKIIDEKDARYEVRPPSAK